MKINSNKFGFQFFLGGIKRVSDLCKGALENGGATKFETGVYSNVATDEYIKVNEGDNKLALFVPDTTDVNNKCDNTQYITYCLNKLQQQYINAKITFVNTLGSWYSEDMNQVVYDNITIITLELNTLTENDINVFVSLAQYIKKEMKQEGVSININGALGII